MKRLILTPFRGGILWAALLALSAVVGSAQSASISFQGQLADGNVPATGRYDFVFRLFGAATGGTEVAPVILTADLAVTNGHFSVPLDFGLAAYAGGPPRWVQVEVRTASTADAYSALLPRTALTPVPFALYALTAGQVSSANLPTNLVYAVQLLATNSALLSAFAADLLTTSNGVSARLLATNTAVVSALASEGLLRTNGQAVLATDLAAVTNGLSARLLATNSALLTALAGDLLSTSNGLSARLVGTNTALAASVAALQAQWLTGSNVVSGSNYFSGALVATNATVTGTFTGSGAGLTNVAVAGLAGTLGSGQLPATVVYTAQLLATNSALLTAFAADLLTTSNGVSARLLATNTVLVSALAAEGLLRTNGQAVLATDVAAVTNGLSARLLATNSALLTALAGDLLSTSNGLSARLVGTNTALAASVAALQAQWLTGSNVVSGSNYFSGALVATNATVTGTFTGSGAGLTNVAVAGLAGTLGSGQLPATVVYTAELQATNVSLQSAFTMNLLSISNDFSSRLVATNTALVAGAVLGTNYEAAMATLLVAIPNQIFSSNNVHLGSNYFFGPATFAGANVFVGPSVFPGPMSAYPPDETVVPLRISNYINTNRFSFSSIIDGGFTTTNLFEIQTGLISNTLSVDAAGRLSLGRKGRVANALLQLSGDAAKRVGYDQTYVHYEPALVNPDRTAGWSFRGGHGENYTDVRKNKFWTWGFNNREGQAYRTNEPSLFLTMETWWEPWPGAGEQDHQIELYWQFSNVGNTFGVRPWAMLLRGSNFLHHDIKVDDFSVGNADGTKPDIFQLETFRTPVNAGRINFTGQIYVKSSSIGGGMLLQDTTLQLSNQDKGQVAVMGWTGTDFALHGMDSLAPGAAFRLWGFTNVTVVPRAENHVSLTISGVTRHATNLVEFRNQGDPALLASVSSNGVISAAGFSSAGSVGITTNVALLAPGGGTNTLVFRNGILVEVR